MDPAYYDLQGVPISAIIFGGRRQTRTPLVFQSYNWDHGVFIGSCVASEMTAAAEGGKGQLRFDPFAMLPFCGYNMADYWQHWIDIGKRSTAEKLPKIFNVNWFRKKDGKFLWPGFGDNSRVLKFIVEQCEGKNLPCFETPIGLVPKASSLDLSGLSMPEEDLKEVLSVDAAGYLEELKEVRAYDAKFGDRLPKAIVEQTDLLEARLQAALKN